MSALKNIDDFESNKYICIVNKRLRTLKKKCRHIDELKTSNRKLTTNDLATLESENNIKANINELEKLKLLLIEAANSTQAEDSNAEVATNTNIEQVVAETAKLTISEPDYVVIDEHRDDKQYVTFAGAAHAVVSAQILSESVPAVVEEKVEVVAEKPDFTNQLKQLLRLIHLGRLFDASLDKASAAQRSAVLECFNGTVSENDLDGIQQLKQLIDGSNVNFSNDGLVPNEVFHFSLEHVTSFLAEKDAEVIPNVTYNRVFQIVEGLAPFFVVVEEETTPATTLKRSGKNRKSSNRRGKGRRDSQDEKVTDAVQPEPEVKAVTEPVVVVETPVVQKQETSKPKSNNNKQKTEKVEKTEKLESKIENTESLVKDKTPRVRSTRGRGGRSNNTTHQEKQDNPSQPATSAPVRNYAEMAAASNK